MALRMARIITPTSAKMASHLVHIGSEHTAFHFELQNHDLFFAEEDHIRATPCFIRKFVFEDYDELRMLRLNGR